MPDCRTWSSEMSVPNSASANLKDCASDYVSRICCCGRFPASGRDVWTLLPGTASANACESCYCTVQGWRYAWSSLTWCS